MKIPILLQKVIMQANNLNRLLYDEETPRTAIEYEAYQLTQALEEYRSSSRKVNLNDIGIAIEVLKKAQKRIDKYDEETNHD